MVIWASLFTQSWVSSSFFSSSKGLKATHRSNHQEYEFYSFLVQRFLCLMPWGKTNTVTDTWFIYLIVSGSMGISKRGCLYPRSSQVHRSWASPSNLSPYDLSLSSVQTPPWLFPLLWSQEYWNFPATSSLLCLHLQVSCWVSHVLADCVMFLKFYWCVIFCF